MAISKNYNKGNNFGHSLYGTPIQLTHNSYFQTNLEAIQEDALAALENKNPSIKIETASFLARSFTKCTPTILTKKLLKGYVAVLLKTFNDSGKLFVSSEVKVNISLSVLSLLFQC